MDVFTSEMEMQSNDIWTIEARRIQQKKKYLLSRIADAAKTVAVWKGFSLAVQQQNRGSSPRLCFKKIKHTK